MLATIGDIIQAIETFAPSDLAESWDNVGLQVGQKDWPVRAAWVALDPSIDVVTSACEKGIELLITHHPLIFRPLKSIDFNTPVGAIIRKAVQYRLGLFAAHTNLDNATDGISEVLATRIGLKNLQVLTSENEQGPGRLGTLEKSLTLTSFARTIKEILDLKSVKIAGRSDLPVNKAAVCAGSGSSLLNHFLLSDAQVYVSGDLRYHDARTVNDANRGLIDIGHFASEYLMVEILARRLQKILSEKGMDIKIEACALETDPFMII
jgi:dinuclear metal center YbgI/SA1388 family protein